MNNRTDLWMGRKYKDNIPNKFNPTEMKESKPTESTIQSHAIIKNDSLALYYNDIVKEIDNNYNDINTICKEQTSGMSLDGSIIYKSVNFVNGNNSSTITAETYRRAYYLSNGQFSEGDIGSKIQDMQKLDLLSMLWSELKILIADWIGDKLEKIPLLKSLAKDIRESAKENSAKEQLKRENIPSNNSVSYTDIKDLYGTIGYKPEAASHGKKVVDYVRNWQSEPRELNYNPIALDAQIITEARYKSFQDTKGVIDIVLGVKNKSKDLTSDSSTYGKYMDYEFKDKPRLLLQGLFTKDGYISDIVKIGVEDFKETLVQTKNILGEYITNEDIACCLLTNMGGVMASDKTLNIIKAIRLGLRYSYNGLDINTGDSFNKLVDIVNQIIGAAIGKVMKELTEKLDDGILTSSNYLRGYSDKGDAWKRCYPFDELMQLALQGVDKMKDDILAYLNDWTNMFKLSNIQTNTYMITLKKRELLRKAIGITEMMSKGLQTGTICKDLKDMEKPYSKPTIEEVMRVRDTARSIRVDEAVKYRDPILDPLSQSPDQVNPIDNLWLQKCDLSLGDSELKDFAEGLDMAIRRAANEHN